MNWGHSITIIILLFLAGMLGMVYYASLQTNEMMDDHYYEKEMQYQHVIDARKNLLELSSASMISQNQEAVIITFPANSYEQFNQGTIELLRNDSKDKDVNIHMQKNGTNTQRIPKSMLTAGMYKARIKWTNDGKEYYSEENLYVQ